MTGESWLTEGMGTWSCPRAGPSPARWHRQHLDGDCAAGRGGGTGCVYVSWPESSMSEGTQGWDGMGEMEKDGVGRDEMGWDAWDRVGVKCGGWMDGWMDGKG